jgi:hypothetical protein
VYPLAGDDCRPAGADLAADPWTNGQARGLTADPAHDRSAVFTFIGLPLKVRNGCGTPIRALALTED